MISAIILAAGLSSRMGHNKLLKPIGHQSIIEHVVENVLACQVDEVIVVLGRDAELIRNSLKRFKITTILNTDYKDGQSTSVKAGLKVISPSSEGALFIMGDQPLINHTIVDQIIKQFKMRQQSIVVPIQKGKRGNPVLFASKWYETLNQVQGDKGGRDILKKHPEAIQYVEIEDPLFFQDVDDAESFELLEKEWQTRKKIYTDK